MPCPTETPLHRAARTCPTAHPARWQAVVARYQTPAYGAAAVQVANSYGGLLLCWWLAYRAIGVAWPLAVLPILLAAGFVVRIFIIQHDCGHGSFTPSRALNDVIGHLCSLVTLTPYLSWRHDHAVHHATAGNLARRGTGDIWTMTVAEYQAAGALRRWWYRTYRSPGVLFVIGPVVHFVLIQRFTTGLPPKLRRERRAVHLTNLALLLEAVLLGHVFGWPAFLAVHLPIAFVSSSAGVWLFYVQHQYEQVYWAHGDDWDYAAVALRGSSYYRLPRWLQWFTGNIGFHHVHHLSPRIPNYRLQACHEENDLFAAVPVMSVRASLASIPLALWDETAQRLLSFGDVRRRPAGRKPTAGCEPGDGHRLQGATDG